MAANRLMHSVLTIFMTMFDNVEAHLLGERLLCVGLCVVLLMVMAVLRMFAFHNANILKYMYLASLSTEI